MRERREIVQRWRQGSASVLITLVRFQGSSYRQLGARLLACSDGSYAGSISGGCLESDLLRKSSWLVHDGAAIASYSTLLGEDAEMPFGLGCGGVIDLLLEPVNSPECQALLQAFEATLAGAEHFIATWLPSKSRKMMRAILSATGELVFASTDIDSGDLQRWSANYLHELSSGSGEVFFERLRSPQRLFIFGAGEDARPLVSMAASLGWHVTVLDGRPHLARRERFPDANDVEVIEVGKVPAAKICTNDAVVLMTHSYEQDRDYLASVLPLGPRYLGLLGSRKRSSLLIAGVASKIGWTVTECCEHICVPIGLDLGGDGPEAIALAVIAEIQAYCMGKQVASRKLSEEQVQLCLSDDSSQNFLRAQCGLDFA